MAELYPTLNSGGKQRGMERLGGDTTEPLLLMLNRRVWQLALGKAAHLTSSQAGAFWDVALDEEHGPDKFGGLASPCS